MAFEKLTDSIHELKESINAFKHSSAEYYKLNLYQKLVKGVITLIQLLLIGFISLFIILFLSIALAVYLSNLIGVPSAGYFIVAGIYVLLLVILFTVGKKYIEKTILVKSSRKFFND